MLKPKYRIFIVIIVLLSLLPLIYLAFLMFGVRNETVENIYHRGQKYKVSKGLVYDEGSRLTLSFSNSVAVLRLANTFANIQNDPLLTNGDFDSEEMRIYISDISDIQGRLLEKSSSTVDFIPTRFLEALLLLSSERNKLEGSISKESLDLYLDKTEAAISLYEKNIESNLNIVSKYPVHISVQNIFALTKVGNLADTYRQMQNNVRELYKEIEKKRNILAGRGINAEARSRQDDIVSISSRKAKPALAKEDLLSSKIYSLVSPRQLTTTTTCFDGKNDEKTFYLYDYKDGTYILPKLINNNFFNKAAGTEIYKLENDMGLGWAKVQEGNSYHCVDNTYQADIYDIYSYINSYPATVLHKIKDADVLGSLSDREREKVERAIEAENNFYKSENIYYTDLQYLATNYESIERIVQKRGFAGGVLLTRELKERSQLIKYREASPKLIFASRFSLNSLYELTENAGFSGDDGSRYLYLTRTNYAITYLNYSPLVWRLSQRPEGINVSMGKSEYVIDFEDLVNRIGIQKVRQIESISRTQELEYAGY